MPYGTTRKRSSGNTATTTKPLSEMTKAEKEERARQMNAQASATVGKRKTKYAKPQRGAKTGTAVGNALRSIFGGSKSTASTPKAKKTYSSNPARAARQKAREKGKEKVCGPNGCMTRRRMERLRDR